jgi:hypothetical protein
MESSTSPPVSEMAMSHIIPKFTSEDLAEQSFSAKIARFAHELKPMEEPFRK